jgi:hypothetical protein
MFVRAVFSVTDVHAVLSNIAFTQDAREGIADTDDLIADVIV